MPAKITRMVPPLWLIYTAIAMWLLDGLVPLFALFPPGALWIGRGMILLGFALVFYSAHQFRKAETPLKPFQKVTAVLTAGPFRFSRNPVYLGMFILLAGWAVALGSLSPWVCVMVFIWMIRTFWVLPEEAQMEREMGQTYLDYKARVRRWL